MIITIARHCGCGAIRLGKLLAEKYGIPFYTRKDVYKRQVLICPWSVVMMPVRASLALSVTCNSNFISILFYHFPQC